MKNAILGAIAIATLTAPMAVTPALAQPGHDHGDNRGGRDGGWHGGDHGWDPANNYRGGGRGGDRRLGRDDQVYRGHDGRYYCRRNDGSTGLVIGALGGGAAGALLGGGTLGTLLGAGGGALLGRSIDRGNVHCR